MSSRFVKIAHCIELDCMPNLESGVNVIEREITKAKIWIQQEIVWLLTILLKLIFSLQNFRINFTSQKLEGSYRWQSWADIEKVWMANCDKKWLQIWKLVVVFKNGPKRQQKWEIFWCYRQCTVFSSTEFGKVNLEMMKCTTKPNNNKFPSFNSAIQLICQLL